MQSAEPSSHRELSAEERRVAGRCGPANQLGDQEAEAPCAMADAITYADLRFVKGPLKSSLCNHVGQGKVCLL